MALAVLTLACFLFYATSRYFPKAGLKRIKDNKRGMLIAASVLSILSLILFTLTYDFATSLVMWMVALMTVLSAIILSLKLNFRWVWIWGGLCLVFILIDIL